jgi:hypothetical protein
MSGIIGGAGSKSGVIGQTELDYEEGTFTVSSNTGTIGSETGFYTRIGNLCQFSIYAYNFTGQTGGVAFDLYGLPFTSKNHETMATMLYSGLDYRGTATQLTPYLHPNNTGMRIFETGNGVGKQALTYAQTDSGTEVRIAGTYQVV